MKEIYLIRHAETDDNNKKIYIGQSDNKLNETGIKQAEELKNKLPDYDLIISSDLARAKQTAEIINKNKKPILFTNLLRERDIGEWTGVHKDEFQKRWSSKKEKDCIFRPGGGESYEDLLFRFQKVLQQIQSTEHKRILLVTHGRLIKTALNHYEDKPLCNQRDIKNCDINKLVIDSIKEYKNCKFCSKTIDL